MLAMMSILTTWVSLVLVASMVRADCNRGGGGNVPKKDVFSSIHSVERLLVTETEYVRLARLYLAEETQRLGRLQRLLDASDTVIGPDFRPDNPVDAYRLIRMQAVRTRAVNKIVRIKKSNELVDKLTKFEGLAKDEDVEGSIEAIVRLQDTYDISAADFAAGRLLRREPPAAPAAQMTVYDCYAIGRMAHNYGDHYHALPWLLLTEDKLQLTNYTAEINRTVFYEQLRNSSAGQGNPEWARHYEQLAAGRGLNSSDPASVMLPPLNNTRPGHWVDVDPAYRSLCNKQNITRATSDLYCYLKRDLPFLRLAPIKVEKLLADPEVLLFKQAIHDSEIAQGIHLAVPHLHRAMVSGGGGGMTSKTRIAQVWFLPLPDEKRYFGALTRRIEHMTNLDVHSPHTETLQVANYGMGGQYTPHMDAFRTKANETAGRNRIATFLIYLDAVEAGGATVFSRLNLSVRPSKYDALFWHNLDPSGRLDDRTLHAGCPVLRGQKWIVNKWIGDYGQELRRPCGTQPELPEPVPEPKPETETETETEAVKAVNL